MVQVKDVSTDMGAAALGLSLTFTNLEEVQTDRRGKEKNQKKKKKPTTKKPTYTHKNHTAGQGQLQDTGEEKDTTHSCSHHKAHLDFSIKSDG